MNYFKYKDISSLDMGLRIQHKDIFSAPSYDKSFKSIPGRRGDIILANQSYPNAQISYTVFIVAKSISELSSKVTAVKAWLYSDQDRYHTLKDSYDTSYTRQACFSGKLSITEQLNKIGVFNIVFSCKPFRYRIGGENNISVSGQNFLITNPESFESQPIITLTSSGTTSLTLQHESTNRTWHIKGVNGNITLDSEQMNAFYGTNLLNDKIQGEAFPLLYPGKNYVSWTGSISNIKIKPRWVTI